jgi:uncharacterized protein YbaR (Trm112 family)
MIARTKLQKAIMSEVAKLPSLTVAQAKAAKLRTLPHLAKRTADGYFYCLECGECWKADDTADNVVCPHCHTKLEVDTSKQRSFRFQDYFMIVTKRGEYQVLRMFYIQAKLRKGMPCEYWIKEAFQRWITADGRSEIIGRKRNCISRYYDSWDWTSDLDLRKEHYAHSVIPEYIYNRKSVIDTIKRNGFTGDFHGISPRALFTAILTDNRCETLLKVGLYDLLRHFVKTNYRNMDKLWSAVKVAMRHHYSIKEADLWCDMIETMTYLGKDILNPKFVCPDNLNEAHDHWQHLKDAKLAKERERREREREAAEAARYLADTENVEADEANYHKAKSKFFDINICNDEITIRPLQSVKEFIDESSLHHHCVFSNKYYSRDNSLILHAVVNGVSVETIEVSLSSLEIVQSRGHYNQRSEYHDQIMQLMKLNMGEVAKRLTA